MSSFFYQQAQIMMAKHIDSYPLLKLSQVLDWQPIEQLLHQQKARYLRDHRGRPAYSLLSMFKAVLLGQWHSLSDPELERCLATRLDFYSSAVLTISPYPTTAPSAASATGWHKTTP